MHRSLERPGAIDGQAPVSDAELVVRVVGGERALFAVLMRRYNQRLYRVTRAILGNDAEAEDAMQQAYLAAYRNLGAFAWESSFPTWTARIARNEALARLAKTSEAFAFLGERCDRIVARVLAAIEAMEAPST